MTVNTFQAGWNLSEHVFPTERSGGASLEVERPSPAKKRPARGRVSMGRTASLSRGERGVIWGTGSSQPGWHHSLSLAACFLSAARGPDRWYVRAGQNTGLRENTTRVLGQRSGRRATTCSAEVCGAAGRPQTRQELLILGQLPPPATLSSSES